MHDLVYWIGFLGAWLLFAGPVYQAGIELRAEAEVGERVERAKREAPRAAPVSAWWWLFPPLHFYLTQRRQGEVRDRVLAQMSEEEVEMVVRYLHVARGWALVAAGAWLIALKETWELAEHGEWHGLLYAVVVLVMSLVALGIAGSTARHQGAPRRWRTTG